MCPPFRPNLNFDKFFANYKIAISPLRREMLKITVMLSFNIGSDLICHRFVSIRFSARSSKHTQTHTNRGTCNEFSWLKEQSQRGKRICQSECALTLSFCLHTLKMGSVLSNELIFLLLCFLSIFSEKPLNMLDDSSNFAKRTIF